MVVVVVVVVITEVTVKAATDPALLRRMRVEVILKSAAFM